MKFKDFVVGLFVVPFFIPIILIAAIQDKKKLDKEIENKKLSKKSSEKSAIKQSTKFTQ